MAEQKEKIKVLVVDDSALMRKLITDILETIPNIEVVGTAINGQVALSKLKQLDPDVITLDVEMPFMNGIETLKEIPKIKPVPTIMLSSLTQKGAEVTMQALELGAVDFIQKPEGGTKEVENISKELIEKVIAAAGIKNAFVQKKIQIEKPEIIDIKKTTPKISRVKTVIIGSSTGGPQALREVIPYIPKTLPAQILIVQHMPPKFTDMFAQRLNGLSQITVKEAKDGDLMEAQKALVAPGNYHMCVNEHNKIDLIQTPQVCGVRPAVDITLLSAAKIFKEDLICVILTGMGHDGTRGVEEVKKYGGYCITEDKSTAVIYGMPKSIKDAGFSDEEVPLNNIANAIVRAVYK